MKGYVDAIAKRDSSMGRKLAGMLSALLEQVDATDSYLESQLSSCQG